MARATIATNEKSQSDGLQRFLPLVCGADRAALDFLLQEPRSALSISPDNLRCAFLWRITSGALLIAESLAVPSHYLPERGLVFGNLFCREPAEDEFECGEWTDRDTSEVLVDPAGLYQHTLSHFAFSLATGRLVQVAPNKFGSLQIFDYELRENGFEEVRAGFIHETGDIDGFMAKPLCRLHDQADHHTAQFLCGCSTLSDDSYPASQPMSFSSWAQVLDLGNGRQFPVHSMDVRVMEGYESKLPAQIDLNEWSFHFHPDDSRLLEVRAAYLNFFTVLTLSIIHSPNDPSVSPDERREIYEMNLWTTAVEKAPTEGVSFGDLEVESLASSAYNDTADFAIDLPDPDVIFQEVPPLPPPPEPKRLRQYECSYCPAVFTKSNNRNRHVASAHLGNRKFKCTYCEIEFAQLANLKRHVAAVHEKKKPFVCPVCDVSVSSKANLQRHANAKHKTINLSTFKL